MVCEGYRHETPWVVEVFRPSEGRDAPLLDSRVTLALVTDEDLPHHHRFTRDDVPALAEYLGRRFALSGFGRTDAPDAGGTPSGAASAQRCPTCRRHRSDWHGRGPPCYPSAVRLQALRPTAGHSLRAPGRTTERPWGGDTLAVVGRAETPRPPRVWKGARDMTRRSALPGRAAGVGPPQAAGPAALPAPRSRLVRTLTFAVLLAVAAGLLGAAACGSSRSGEPATLHVLAAASLTEAFTEIGAAFEHDHPA